MFSLYFNHLLVVFSLHICVVSLSCLFIILVLAVRLFYLAFVLFLALPMILVVALLGVISLYLFGLRGVVINCALVSCLPSVWFFCACL